MDFYKTTGVIVAGFAVCLLACLFFVSGCSVGFQASPAYPGAVTQAQVLEDHAKAISGLQTNVKEIADFINKATLPKPQPGQAKSETPADQQPK